eukprot:6666692-Lingulodinium_polyedra.AAC.1
MLSPRFPSRRQRRARILRRRGRRGVPARGRSVGPCDARPVRLSAGCAARRGRDGRGGRRRPPR